MLYHSFVGLPALLLQPLRLFSGQQGIAVERLTNIHDKVRVTLDILLVHGKQIVGLAVYDELIFLARFLC